MSKVIRQGRSVHKCDTPAPGRLALGAVVQCACGRRWKLGRVGFTFKGWRRTVLTLLRDLLTRRRAVNTWAAVSRWEQAPGPEETE